MDSSHDGLFFIVNRFSGKGVVPRLERGIASICGAQCVRHEIAYTAAPQHATTLARDAIAQGFRKIIAVGGDGTINEVARAVIHTPAALGIIPKGSGNGLARHLGIPLKIEAALQYLFQSDTIAIDTFHINGRLSLNVSGIGFDGFVAAKFAERKKRGLAGYVQLVIKGYRAFREFEVTIDAEGPSVRRKAFVIAIANSSQYGNNARIAPAASLCDGRLNMVVLRKFPLYRLDLIPAFFRGGMGTSRWWESREIVNTELRLPAPVSYHVDGEAAGVADKFIIQLQPASLNVLVPRGMKC